MITITGIAIAGINRGQSVENSQSDCNKIIAVSTNGKVTEAAIDAKETYRQMNTTTIHTVIATNAQTE